MADTLKTAYRNALEAELETAIRNTRKNVDTIVSELRRLGFDVPKDVRRAVASRDNVEQR